MFFSTLSFYDNFAENVVIFVVMSLAFFQPKYLKCDQLGRHQLTTPSSKVNKISSSYYAIGFMEQLINYLDQVIVVSQLSVIFEI